MIYRNDMETFSHRQPLSLCFIVYLYGPSFRGVAMPDIPNILLIFWDPPVFPIPKRKLDVDQLAVACTLATWPALPLLPLFWCPVRQPWKPIIDAVGRLLLVSGDRFSPLLHLMTYTILSLGTSRCMPWNKYPKEIPTMPVWKCFKRLCLVVAHTTQFLRSLSLFLPYK